MKTKIYFVRHGEVYNPREIWYGSMPFYHLSEKGILQIKNVAEDLYDKHIDSIYSSPLLRARQSARILKNKLKLSKVHLSKKLIEVQSSLAGRTLAYLDTIQYNVFASDDNHVKGETIEELGKRMQDFINQIVELHKGKKVIAVSHGDPIMMVKAIAAGLPIKNESIRPGRRDYIQPGGIYELNI